MNSRRKATKPKKGRSAGADAPGDKVAHARKEVFDLVEADSIHDLMDINGPKVARWALQCVQKVARGRASLLEQKIALMMIQKCTPSTGRKTEEEGDELPEGTTKAELQALNALIDEHKQKTSGLSPAGEGAKTRITRDVSTYQVREPKVE